MIIILYFLSVFIVYIVLRYLVISGKWGLEDDPQVISLILSCLWPVTIVIIIIFKLGEIIDKVIKSKING